MRAASVPDRLRAVEDDDPRREALGELPVAVRHGRVKRAVLLLHAVGGRARALGGGLTVDEQDERAVGREIGDGDVQLEHTVDAEPARDALVRERRVEVAVAHDVRARGERRPDHALCELGPRGGEERRLGPRRGMLAVEQEAADLLPERRAPGLARGHDLTPGRSEMLREQRRLRRLPRAVHPFERDEHQPTTIRRVRAVVTGGAGFIGSHLVDALVARGDDVTVIDNLSTGRRENVNPQAKLVEHDIREPFEVEADAVFHLAAQADVVTSVERPTYDAEVNVIGTLRVLEAAKERAGGVHVDRRRDLRRVRAAGARGRSAAPAVAVRHVQARRRGVPRHLEPAARHGPRRAQARATSTAPASSRSSRAA